MAHASSTSPFIASSITPSPTSSSTSPTSPVSPPSTTSRPFSVAGCVVVALMVLAGAGCDAGYKSELENPTGKEHVPTPAPMGALMAPERAEGAKENDGGVGHYKQGHWNAARSSFQNAIATNNGLAEAHYNLGLALDKLGNHGDATSHFRMALNRAPDNPAIANSAVLKAHVGH